MASYDPWGKWKVAVLDWINALNPQGDSQLTFSLLEDEVICRGIFKDILKPDLKRASAEDLIQSFLREEYPDIKLTLGSDESELILLLSLLLHFWSIRLPENEHKARGKVCARLGDNTQRLIHHFLEKLMPENTACISKEQLVKAIESLTVAASVKEAPATPCFTNRLATPRCDAGSLRKFLASPVARHQKLLADRQRQLQEVVAELEQEQSEKNDLQKELNLQIEKAHKLDHQLKTALGDIGVLEEEVLNLRKNNCERDAYAQVKNFKEEIISLNKIIADLNFTYQPIEDEKIKLENRCAKLEESVKTLKETNNEQENLIKCLSLDLEARRESYEELYKNYQELDEHVKELRNDGNNSSEFDVSFTSQITSRLLTSPMPIIDNLPLSSTVIDLQLREKAAEVNELRLQLNAVIEEQSKLTEVNKVQESELLTSRSEIEALLVRCEDYDSKIAEMEADIDKKMETITETEQLRQALDCRVAELKEMIIGKSEIIKDLEQTCSDLNNELSKMEENKVQASIEFEEKKADLEKTIVEKNQEIIVLTLEREVLRQEIENSEQTLAKKDIEIGNCTQEREDLRSQFNVAIEERSKLTEENKVQESELLKSRSEIDALLVRCVDYESKNAEMEADIRKKGEVITETEQLRQALDFRVAELDEMIIGKSEIIKDLEQTCSDLTNELSKMEENKVQASIEFEEKKADLEKTIVEKSQEFRVLGMEQEVLRQEIGKCTEERDDFRLQLNAVIEEQSKLTEVNKVQESDLLTSRTEIEALLVRCEDYDSKIAKMEADIDKKMEIITETEQLRQALDCRVAELSEMIIGKSEIMKDLEQTCSDLTNELSKMEENKVQASIEFEEKKADLEKTIVEKSQEIIVLTLEQEVLRQEIENSGQTLAKKDIEIGNCTQEREDLRSQFNVAIEERSKLTEENKVQESELLKSRSEIDALLVRCVDYESKNAEMEADIRKKGEVITETEQLRQALDFRVAELDEMIIGKSEIIKDLEQTCSDLTNELSKMEENKVQASIEFEEKKADLEKTIVEKSQEFRVLGMEQEVLRQEIGKCTEERDDFRLQLNAVIEERSKLTEVNKVQESELLTSRSEIEALLVRCEDYDSKIAEMEADIDKKMEIITETEQLRQALDCRVAELSEMIIGKSEIMKDLEQTCSDLTNELSKIEENKVLTSIEFEEKKADLEKTIVEKSQVIIVLTLEREVLRQEIENSKQTLAKKEIEIGNCTQERVDLRSQLNYVIEERSKLTEENKVQESELLTSRSEIEALLVRCEDYDSKIAEMEANIEKKKEVITETEQLRQTLDCRVAELSEMIIRKSEIIIDLEQTCSDLTNKLSKIEENKVQASIEFEENKADLEKTIVEKTQEFSVLGMEQEILRQEIGKCTEERDDLRLQLNAVIEERSKLTEENKVQESEILKSHSEIEALLVRCEDYDSKIAEKEANIDKYVKNLHEVSVNLEKITEDRNDFSSQLHNLKLNFDKEIFQFSVEKSSLSDKISAIAKEMEGVIEDKNTLKETINANDSFLNNCISNLSNILATDTMAEGDLDFIGNFLQTTDLQMEHLISRVEEKCKMYRTNIMELKAAIEDSENNWTCQLMRLNEELCSAGEREQAAIAANSELEEQLNTEKVNLAEDWKELSSQVNDISNLINCADNAVLVNSSATSMLCSDANSSGYHHLHSKLALLRDSILLLVRNKSILFEDLCLVKEQYTKKVEEWQLLVAQADTLKMSCNDLKAEIMGLQQLLEEVGSSRDEGRAEIENWKKEYGVVEEKVNLMELKLVADSSLKNCLKIQVEALQIRNGKLLTDIEKKMKLCQCWENVFYDISNFKKMINNRMEYILSSKSQIEDQLTKMRSKYHHLSSCQLGDLANLKEMGSLKSEIGSDLSNAEGKYNAVSLDLLNCVYASLHYPYVLIHQQHLNTAGENVLTNPNLSQESHEAIEKQITHIETVIEGILSKIMVIPLKIQELEDNCLSPSSSSSDHSFLNDSLEENQCSALQGNYTVAPAWFEEHVADLEDPRSAAIRSVVGSIIASQACQFQKLLGLKTEIQSLDEKNTLGCKELAEAIECKEKLEKKIFEQQSSAVRLNDAYTVLLKECENAQNDAKKFKEMLTRREEDSKIKDIRTKQLEEQIKLCFTEEQVAQKVERLGSEYQGKLDKMKVKMGDLFRKETSRLDEAKDLACSEIEKQCKSEHDNDIRRYKIYVKEQALEIDSLKQKLQQEKMESTFLSKTVTHLEKQLGATNSFEHQDPLVMKRDTVMEHLQRRGEMAGHSRSHTATSTTVERVLDSAGGFYRRQSISTQKSISSLHSIPSESFAGEDEEGEVFNNTYLQDLKAGHVALPGPTGTERIGELQYRNSLCLPHLKSSYPAETQFHDPHSFRDEDVKLGFSLENNQSDTSSLLPGERQRKRDRGKNQTSYQKPGPPTPIKNGGRRSLQGGELLSPRSALREVNDGAARKISTPNRIRSLFSTKSKRDENSPMTPRGRRLSLFRKSARGREDC